MTNTLSKNTLITISLSIWAVSIVNWALSYQLNHFGLYPRDLTGLTGIITTPFLHSDFAHLSNNTFAFLTLGWLVSLYDKQNVSQLLRLTVFVIILGGILTWLFARPSYHVGLSGVIFGYWGFITINGIIDRTIKSIFISIIAILFYGSMVFGVLPSASISFESHIFGAMAGMLYSYFFYGKRKKK